VQFVSLFVSAAPFKVKDEFASSLKFVFEVAGLLPGTIKQA